jgi:hypothetical protein
MGRPKKKKKSDYNPSIQEINAMVYCINNGIKIYPILINFNKFLLNIEIERNKLTKHIQSNREYEQHELLRPTYQIYLKYFLQIADAEIIKKSVDSYIKF